MGLVGPVSQAASVSPVLHVASQSRCTLAGLMSRAGPANAVTWKNLSPVSRYPGSAILGSRLTGLVRLSCIREVDFCYVYQTCRDPGKLTPARLMLSDP